MNLLLEVDSLEESINGGLVPSKELLNWKSIGWILIMLLLLSYAKSQLYAIVDFCYCIQSVRWNAFLELCKLHMHKPISVHLWMNPKTQNKIFSLETPNPNQIPFWNKHQNPEQNFFNTFPPCNIASKLRSTINRLMLIYVIFNF